MKMTYEIFRKLNQKGIKVFLLVVGVIAFLMMSTNILGFMNDYSFSSFEMLDVKFFYDQDTFTLSILIYQISNTVNAYLILHAEDYVFILTFYLWLAIVLFDLLEKNQSVSALVILPLLAMLFDLAENLVIDVALTSGVGEFWATICGYLTLFKFVFLVISILAIFYQLLIIKRHHKWEN